MLTNIVLAGIRNVFQTARCSFAAVASSTAPTGVGTTPSAKPPQQAKPTKKLRGKERPPKPDTFVAEMSKYSPRIVGDEGFVDIYQKPHFASTRLKLDWWNERDNFHHWTKWSMRRDNRHRQILKEYAPHRLRLKAIKYARVLPVAIQKEAAEKIHLLPLAAHFMTFRNRCQITSRHRGNVMRYRLSRIVFRDFADHGKLSGVKRGIW